METLTGAPAAGYISAWMASATRGGALNASRVCADALAARTNRKALSRLRLACVSGVRRVPVLFASTPRRTRVKVTVGRRPRGLRARARAKPRRTGAA